MGEKAFSWEKKVGEQSKRKPAVKERMEGYPTKYSFRIYICIYIIYVVYIPI